MSRKRNTKCDSLPVTLATGPAISTDDEPAGCCSCCDGWGYLYEGGMSMNPEIDNRAPCPNCNPDPDPP